jgi:hypothetical protein
MKCESRQWFAPTNFALQNVLGIPESNDAPTFWTGDLITDLAYLGLLRRI